jgi:hypothetical protein
MFTLRRSFKMWRGGRRLRSLFIDLEMMQQCFLQILQNLCLVDELNHNGRLSLEPIATRLWTRRAPLCRGRPQHLEAKSERHFIQRLKSMGLKISRTLCQDSIAPGIMTWCVFGWHHSGDKRLSSSCKTFLDLRRKKIWRTRLISTKENNNRRGERIYWTDVNLCTRRCGNVGVCQVLCQVMLPGKLLRCVVVLVCAVVHISLCWCVGV